MRRSSFLILGAAVAVGLAARPAMADVHQVGSVNVSADHYTNVSWEHFEGPVDRLQARERDIVRVMRGALARHFPTS